MPSPFELHLEYASLLGRYRRLAAGPFADGDEFRRMQAIATRLEEISARLHQTSTVTEQFSSLDSD